MSWITDLFSSDASNLVNSVGNILDKVVTSKGEKMLLDNEIRKAELKFREEISKLSKEEQILYLKDYSSERTMNAKIKTYNIETTMNQNMGAILALIVVVMTFALFFLVVRNGKELSDSTTKDVVIYILGILSAIITQIISFYFGFPKKAK
jgi:hypothetical protein